MQMTAKADASIALGLGLTNECNLACSFCYRDPARADRLSLDQVKSVMERLPVRSVNLGTGENGMHPDYKTILAYLRTRPVKLTITSNGHSVAVLQDHDLRAFHDIEFSLDYPTQAEQDAQRGLGNWELIRQQAERCLRLRVPVTIIAVNKSVRSASNAAPNKDGPRNIPGAVGEGAPTTSASHSGLSAVVTRHRPRNAA